MGHLGVQFLSTNEQMEPGSINRDWIIAGEPKVKSKVLSTSSDGLSFVIVWECSEGQFRWHYHFDEVLYLLEGSVTIDDGSGAPRTVGTGDVVFFRKGSSAVWTVHGHVRKLAVCQRVLPPFLRTPIRLLQALKAGLRGSPEAAPLAGAGAGKAVV